MKNLYIFLFCLFAYQTALATHIIGGSISYEYLGVHEYKIRLEVLRDCYNGIPGFDNPAPIGVYDSNSNLIHHLLVPFNGQDDTVSLAIPNSICVFPSNICVHKAVYEANVFLPDIPGGFVVVYQRCCRSEVISNLVDPLTAGMTFHTTISPPLQNSSPVFDNDFPVATFLNTAFVYDASATDLDGDSLVYELIHPFTGATFDDPMPNPPFPPPYDQVEFVDPPYSVSNMLGGNYPLTIDPVTGEMSAIPPTLGVFQIAYSVKEYRNGQHIGTTYREFTFVVIPTIANQSYDVSGSVFVNNNIPLDEGSVQILERDVNTDSLTIYDEQEISPNGEYFFNDIPPGVFYIKAIVDPASVYYDNYLPTYYDSAVFWYEASAINQCDTSQQYRDIHLIHVDSLTGGIVLDGIVSYAGRSGDPVPALNLLVGNENGEPIQARTTDDEGYFKFENLTPGTYQLFADLINSSIDNTFPPIIELMENTTIQVYLYEDSLSLVTPISGLSQQLPPSDYSVSFYPNPTDNHIQLEIVSQNAGTFTAKIFNTVGQCVHTIFKNKTLPPGTFRSEIQINEIPVGLYFLEIQNESKKTTEKFIKQ